MVQSVRNWILTLFSIFMASPFEEMMTLRPPGVSFLFEVGIYFYSVQKKQFPPIVLLENYCTSVGTCCA